MPEREQYEFEVRMEKLGAMLKKIRMKKNMTQAELGTLIGVQKAQISKLENSASSATVSTIVKVFSALRTRVKFQIEVNDADHPLVSARK